jgi:hypothetical protein
VATSVLVSQHYFCQLFRGDFVSFAKLADGVVLTKKTFQVAVGEKDCSRATGAN